MKHFFDTPFIGITSVGFQIDITMALRCGTNQTGTGIWIMIYDQPQNLNNYKKLLRNLTNPYNSHFLM